MNTLVTSIKVVINGPEAIAGSTLILSRVIGIISPKIGPDITVKVSDNPTTNATFNGSIMLIWSESKYETTLAIIPKKIPLIMR